MKAQDKERQRLVRLIRMLGDFDATPAPLAVREVAETYDVTSRTVQRDISFLREAGFAFDEPSRGCYAFSPGQSLKRIKLSEEEAVLMTFFGDVAAEMGGPFAKTFKMLASKFLADDYVSAYAVKLPGASKRSEYACADVLERCVDGNRKALVVYRKQDGEKEYVLHPYKILYCEGFWYVWGKNERDNKLATFRLDRIVSAEETGALFSVDKDAARLLEEGVNVWMSGLRNTRVLLSIDSKAARYIEEKVFFPMQRIIEKNSDGSLTVESRISHEREILPTIFRWLPHVRVVEPDFLAQKVRDVLAQYASSETAISADTANENRGKIRTKKGDRI